MPPYWVVTTSYSGSYAALPPARPPARRGLLAGLTPCRAHHATYTCAARVSGALDMRYDILYAADAAKVKRACSWLQRRYWTPLVQPHACAVVNAAFVRWLPPAAGLGSPASSSTRDNDCSAWRTALPATTLLRFTRSAFNVLHMTDLRVAFTACHNAWRTGSCPACLWFLIASIPHGPVPRRIPHTRLFRVTTGTFIQCYYLITLPGSYATW